MIHIDNFSFDERLILNSIGLYTSLKDCIKTIMIQSTVVEDEQAKELYSWLYTKLKAMDEMEWNELQKYMPFDVPYGFYDDEEEQEYIKYEEWTDEDYNQFLDMIADMEKNGEEEERQESEGV